MSQYATGNDKTYNFSVITINESVVRKINV